MSVADDGRRLLSQKIGRWSVGAWLAMGAAGVAVGRWVSTLGDVTASQRKSGKGRRRSGRAADRRNIR